MRVTSKAFVAFIFSICGSYSHAEKTMRLPSAGKCLIEICGTYESANLDNPVRPALHSQRIEVDYSKLVQPLIESEIQHEAWGKREALKLIDFISKVDVSSAVYSDDLKLLLNLNEVVRLFGMFVEGDAIEASTGPGGVNLNKEKARSIAVREKIEDIEGALNSVDIFLSTGFFRVFEMASYMKISTHHRVNFPSKSYADFLKHYMEYIDTWSKKLQMIDPFVTPQKPAILKKYLAGETISDADSELFFLAVARAYTVDRAYNSIELNRVFRNMKRNFSIDVNKRLESLINIRPALIQALGQDNLRKRAKEVARYCANNYHKRMKSFPLEEEIDSFRLRYVPQIVAAALKVLDKEELGSVSEKVRSLEWKPPLKYEEALKSMVLDLEEDLEANLESKKSKDLFWKQLRAGDRSTIALAVAKVLSFDPEDLEDVLFSVNSNCKYIKPDGLADSIFTNEKIINVGWRTVLKPESAAFIMGHEIGHLVYKSEKGSSPSIKRKVGCLIEKHSGLESAPHKFSEEDYADLFGFAVEKEFSPQKRSKNLFCYLRPGPAKELNEQYTSLSQTEDRSHSSDLFRLISSAVEHDSLPNSCKEVQKEAKMKNGLERCL